MATKKLYCKADEPKVQRMLACGDQFAKENGWIPVEETGKPAKNQKPKAQPKQAQKATESDMDLPELPKEEPKPKPKGRPRKKTTTAKKTNTKK